MTEKQSVTTVVSPLRPASYSAIKGCWSSMDTNGGESECKYGHTACVDNDSMVVFGGCNSGSFQNEFKLLDLSSYLFTHIIIMKKHF